MKKSSTTYLITPHGDELIDIHVRYVKMRFTDGSIFPLPALSLTAKINNNAMHQCVALLSSMSKFMWEKWISLSKNVGQSSVSRCQSNALQEVRLNRNPTRESWSWY